MMSVHVVLMGNVHQTPKTLLWPFSHMGFLRRIRSKDNANSFIFRPQPKFWRMPIVVTTRVRPYVRLSVRHFLEL